MSKRNKKNNKITFTVEAVKPRNTMVLELANYRGGNHEKSNKAKRQKGKMELRKMVECNKHNHHFLFV